jgi:5'-methylthioadenosine phosphorylase
VREEFHPETPYGYPSDKVLVGTLEGREVAFLPRHGHDHHIPPHRIPYKANLAALKSLGVRHVIGTCVVGSLRQEIVPGSFVTSDQFIDFTHGRDDTFDVDQRLIHLPMGEPYCKTLSRVAADVLRTFDVPVVDHGTVVVIQGPRFSTKAESAMYALLGGDIINMTQYPEVYFARELGLCYGSIASVTDYNVGVSEEQTLDGIESFKQVLPVFKRNAVVAKKALSAIVQFHQLFSKCQCSEVLVRPYYEAG